MSRYQTSTPRTAIGIAAAALTALTLTVAVLLPAGLTAESGEAGLVLAGKNTMPQPPSGSSSPRSPG